MVVVVSVHDYETLTAPKPSFTDFLLHCPKLDGENPFDWQNEYSDDCL